MRIVWLDTARDNLETIAGTIGLEHPASAARWARRVRRRIRLLADFPFSGRAVPEYGFEDLREVVLGDHRVLYRVEATRIAIIQIWDARRPLPDRVEEATVAYHVMQAASPSQG